MVIVAFCLENVLYLEVEAGLSGGRNVVRWVEMG